MPIQIDFSDFVALLTLCLSFYAIKKRLSLQRKADISANFIKVGRNNHKLKVFNKGKGLARDVRIEFPEGIGVLAPDDVQAKFPIPILEQDQSVELLAAVTFQSPSRMTIKLIWNDESGTDNEKTLTPTI